MNHRDLKTFPILTTVRLTLRQLSPNDVKEIFLLRSDAVVNKYIDRQPCKTREDALDFIEKIRHNSQSYWAIEQIGHQKLVGTICLFNISEELQKCEIGFELLPEFHGKGIMREAVNTIIDYAFQVLSLTCIEACSHKNNKISSSLLKEMKFIESDEGGQNISDLKLFVRVMQTSINC